MITALVADDLTVRFYLKFIGDNGIELDFSVLLDTGFNRHVALPRDIIDALGYPSKSSVDIELADGITQNVTLHNGRMIWDGQEVNVPIHCLAGEGLLGTLQAENYILTLPFCAGETVTLVLIP